MSDFTLKEYTQEEYNADLKQLLDEKGLHDAVEGICDRINSIASILDYLKHREIQELLCEILDLIDMDRSEEEWQEKKRISY